jgi:putative endonuclease
MLPVDAPPPACGEPQRRACAYLTPGLARCQWRGSAVDGRDPESHATPRAIAGARAGGMLLEFAAPALSRGGEPTREPAMPYYVYILASQRNGTLYVGVTNDLARRIYEHREGLADGFTRKHSVKTLVYIEPHHDVLMAITREKTLKRWRRSWKLALIERDNPGWRDLYEDINM